MTDVEDLRAAARAEVRRLTKKMQAEEVAHHERMAKLREARSTAANHARHQLRVPVADLANDLGVTSRARIYEITGPAPTKRIAQQETTVDPTKPIEQR